MTRSRRYGAVDSSIIEGLCRASTRGSVYAMQLNARMLELVETLTKKVRCLRREQVERLWFAHAKEPRVICRQYLKRVEAAGLVTLANVMAPPEIDFNSPFLDWRPGNPEPLFDRLAWQAESRLAHAATATLLITATKKAQSLTGGPIGTRPQRSAEIAHDLMTAAVYESFRHRHPDRAASWKPEEAIVQELFAERMSLIRETIPDAIVVDGTEEIIIEIAGRYSASKLRSIHDAYKENRYELW